MYSNHPHWLVLTYLQMSYAQDVTSHQLFFLNFAQVWCGTARPEALRNGTRIQNFNVYFCTQKERSYLVGFLSGIFSPDRDDFSQKFLKVQKL